MPGLPRSDPQPLVQERPNLWYALDLPGEDGEFRSLARRLVDRPVQPSQTGVRQMGKGNNSQKNDKKNKKPKKDAKKPQGKDAGKN